MSLFISFEGVEGSGKTTQIRRVRRYLVRRGFPCVVTREPGGSSISERIRKVLLDPGHREMVALTELLLYEAARAQHVKEVIEPHLKKGDIVLCDRFSDATEAYQGYGRKIDLLWVKKLNHRATGGRHPDLTFLLDCPTETGLRRVSRRNRSHQKENTDRLENEAIQFHRRVRKGYLAIARREPHRVKLIDTRRGEERVFEEIRKILDGFLGIERTRGPAQKSRKRTARLPR